MDLPRSDGSRLSRVGLAALRVLAPVALFLLLWQSLGTFHLVDTAFLPTPLLVGRALRRSAEQARKFATTFW